ncbi:hypothetical protein BBJ28_00002750 [Nothophytophthora sp. Chile5]|nr:hypothetical protein BBJ28_00002750 [Nothophytophthora sp. Chile5]
MKSWRVVALWQTLLLLALLATGISNVVGSNCKVSLGGSTTSASSSSSLIEEQSAIEDVAGSSAVAGSEDEATASAVDDASATEVPFEMTAAPVEATETPATEVPTATTVTPDFVTMVAETPTPSVEVIETEATTVPPTETTAPVIEETPTPTLEDAAGSLEGIDTPGASVVAVSDGSGDYEVVGVITAAPATIAPAPAPTPNWVGPTIGDATDTACYRKTGNPNSVDVCPLGYSNDDDTCWTQCPLSYPVECFAECIPQNDDCALEVLTKITSVAAVAINAATAGVFGEILATYKAVKLGVTCAANLFSVGQSIVRYMRYQQTTAPNGTVEELLAVAYQADVVIVDLPVAICTCLGLPVPANAQFIDTVVTIGENILKQLVTNGDEILSSADSFLSFLSTSDAGNSTTDLDSESVANLTSLIDSGSTCGWELKRLTDRVVTAVNDIRASTPDAAIDDIRTTVSTSSLVLSDIPTVTNNCMGELLASKTTEAAYETRDLLRKTFGVIIDQLIETSTTDLGESLSADDYMLEVANTGLVVLSAIDPTGIAYMASQFVQPICGPTAFLGEIDDGSLADALGLTTVDEAFDGSYGTWTKAGDGVVTLIFESTDTEDVTVVIHSAGDTVEEVDVDSGETVTWTSTVAELQDKTMYLDRWRPGFLGLPGSGGGSLLLWIPRSSEGGHLEMHTKINVS